MRHNIRAWCFFAILFAHHLFIAFPADAAQSHVLVKAPTLSTVYYVDPTGVRHPYPTAQIFRSWYPAGFSAPAIATISFADLAAYPLGPNVPMRPGSLIKMPTAPTVYAVAPGALLHAIASEQTARDLYGDNWATRVIDIPEVFFHNYRIDTPIKGRADLPDGALVTLENEPSQLYYKDYGMLRRFADASAQTLNRVSLTDALTIPPLFTERALPVTAALPRLTDPLWLDRLPAPDCAVTDLRAAVIFLARNPGSDQQAIDQWRTRTASSWERRTDALSRIALDPVAALPYEDRFATDEGLDIREISRTFFDAYPDLYDFLFIWNSFVPAGTAEIADFWPVTNAVEGIGKPLFDRSSIFGSMGKLKGVVNMGRPYDYSLHDTQGMYRAVDTALHELLHQWSGEADFKDASGTERTELQTADTLHWSPYANFISPLGGWGWRPSEAGVFTSARSLLPASDIAELIFPDLDLYLMGLVPRHSVAPIQYLVPLPHTQLTSTMQGTMRTVTIDDIVYGNGIRRCQAESSSSL